MTDLERLRRSYRRWLRAYPAWYRRERGLELLTTLLDDAAPGQRRPRLADVMSLIGGGIRARLRPPRRPVAWAVNVMVTCSVGLLAAAAAVLASPYPGPPAEEQAIAVATIAIGPPTNNVPGPAVACPLGGCVPLGADDQVVAEDTDPMRIDNTVVYYFLPAEEVTTVVGLARDRLAAAGWHVDSEQDDQLYPHFTASTDRLNVLVFADSSLTDDNGQVPTVAVHVSKRVSAATIAGVAGAGLGGLFGGWLLGTWALHRFQRHRRWRCQIIVVAAIPFLTTASLILLITSMIVMTDFADGIDQADIQAPLAFGAIGGLATGVSVFSLLLGLAVLVLTGMPGTPPDSPAGHSPNPARPTPA